MKKLWILAALAAALSLAGLVASCANALSSTPRTVDQTINGFENAISSSDRSTVYTYLDSASGQYGAAKLPATWAFYFPVGETYSFSGRSTSGTQVTDTILSTTTYAGPWTYTLVFVMSTDSNGNAVIHSIMLYGYNGSVQMMNTSIYQ